MVLKTKSIRADEELDDGLRICIMAIYDPNNSKYKPIKLHWRDLAPSEQLLKEYHDGLSWEDYKERFIREVIGPQAKKIRNLAQLAKDKNVTLLCYEDSPEKCHRSLIVGACKIFDKNLEVKIE